MKKLFLVLMLACLFACKKQKEIPKDILPKSIVTKALIEMHIAESIAASKNIRPDSALALYKAEQNIIFKKLKIDSAAYNRSFKYYSGDVKELDEIYGAVVDSLSLREATGKIN